MTNSIADIADDAQAYFIIGSNTTEQHPVIGMKIRQAVKQRGAKLIVADPRSIPISEFATLHLRQKPGSDIALLNAIMNVLIAENLYDAEFVEASWDEALDLVADKLSAIALEHGPDAVGFLSSAKCTNEENYLVQKLARGVIGTNNVDHCARL